MLRPLRFRLNEEIVELAELPDRLVLDWLRRDRRLTGTKEGCREGDCGACLVLLGQRRDVRGQPGMAGGGDDTYVRSVDADEALSYDEIEWLPVTSCLLAMGELDGRQIITIEGLASQGPTPVMMALHKENASQCGFCSPGIVIALTARLIEGRDLNAEALYAALEGNLCRCTGYAAFKRAAAKLAVDFVDLPEEMTTRFALLAAKGVIPAPLAKTMLCLPEPARTGNGEAAPKSADLDSVRRGLDLGGGTDWFVRHPEAGNGTRYFFTDKEPGLAGIFRRDGTLEIGAAVTVRDFFRSDEVRALVPGIELFGAELAGPAIRARATLAGNIANASPVADMTAILLALGARLRLTTRSGTKGSREIDLTEFFIEYKKTVALPDERIEAIILPVTEPVRFSFEKAARRERLDIAAVNGALAFVWDAATRVPRKVKVSAGGIAATPLLLKRTAAMMEGQPVDAALVKAAASVAVAECSPISDVRASAAYRSALVERQIYAHFLRLFPDNGLEEALLP